MARHEQIEKSVLGTMLAENYLIADSGVMRDFFISHVHKNIFQCMQDLFAAKRPVDFVTVLTMMDPTALGGANYLAELTNFASPTKFDGYVEMLLGTWKNREKNKILIQATESDMAIGEIQKALEDLEKSGNAGLDTNIQMDLIRMGERPYEPLVETPGVTTGLKDLEKLLDGFQPAELTIIAARPSMGKTDTLNHFALHAGFAGYRPIIFSLEMSRTSMIDRLIAVTGGYNRLRMRNPYTHFTTKQKANWMPTLGRLDEANIHIDDRAALKVSEMRATARKIINSEPKLKPIIFVDYLQIIRGDYLQQNRTEIVGQISNDLKQMAKEFDCPVVCLSQLNRGVEARDNKRPMMSDLRDSGNIEQDADVIVFLYRDDYYDKETASPNRLEMNVSKNRNGPTGMATVCYVKETGMLHNIDWQTERTV
ncbi:replicative DNA helicase [Sporosarcina sp. G11-34]|uniref:replicative DNA helicase n=1 Tax=Sporosarcina sp. G11-34 TaxID=2849605 RepID=UPI0022A90224|nr:DnaB-like helicase C-terminal domain-containing protein [Sporosarcina sp. G11-34]MCZ2260790.1 DNA helicase [Sporosarcina sp. G11-34]